jgi:hypothetical protein
MIRACGPLRLNMTYHIMAVFTFKRLHSGSTQISQSYFTYLLYHFRLKVINTRAKLESEEHNHHHAARRDRLTEKPGINNCVKLESEELNYHHSAQDNSGLLD